MTTSRELLIDGSQGEGGGQILRTSLTLSTCLGRAFRMINIRAARKNPGLQPQHLAAVRAAAAIAQAEVEGDVKDSQSLLFRPSRVKAGEYHFSVGTAGSTTLVLQTVLPALMMADGPSHVTLEGGTHNPMAPPFDFLHYAFLPLMNRMGPSIHATLERPGFAPKGGGRVRVEIQPAAMLQPLDLTERGSICSQHAEVLLAHLPDQIAQRELAIIKHGLGYADEQLRLRRMDEAYGPGNVVSIIIDSEHVCECFTAFGQRGIPAEQVGENVVKQARNYLRAGVPVGPQLADQLLLPMALACKGLFVTLEPTTHALTNMEVIRAFTGLTIHAEEVSHGVWRVSV